jgi:ABC-type nitrate/sulfonate/bicarbonate transport system permease component
MAAGPNPIADGRRERRGCWIAPATVLAVLIAWQALVPPHAPAALFFPPPLTVLKCMADLTADGSLPRDVLYTAGRLAAAFTIGAVPAILLGMWMGWSRALRKAVDPFIAAFHPVPKVALLPLFMIVLGVGESSKIVIAALSAFFPVLISAMAGVRQISPVHFEVAHNYRASRVKVLLRVVLPGSLPLLLAGLRVGFNSALVVTMAVELLTAHTGLGARVWYAWETMRTEQLYAAVAIISLIGIGANFALRRLTRRLVPWQVDREI